MRAWLFPLAFIAGGCGCSDSNDAHPSAGGATSTGGVGGGIDSALGGASGASGASSGGGTGGVKPDLDCYHVTVEKSCVDGWCRIPAGCFIMGSPKDEWGRGAYDEDQAKVTLTRSFEIQQHEVTQAQWEALGLTNPSAPSPQAGSPGDCLEQKCPVGNVNWYEAAAYANLLSGQRTPALAPCYHLTECTGVLGEGMACNSVTMSAASPYQCEGYRLPTAAEWEYAARAGTKTAFYSGEITSQPKVAICEFDGNLDKIAWYCFNAGGTTHPVGGKQPNAWGLYDMAGNAYEWTNDVTDGIGHGPGPLVDPDESNGFPSSQVLWRGGSVIDYARSCRSAAHFFTSPRSARGSAGGFRLVRTLPPAPPPDAGADASPPDAAQ
ncbi:MAG: formylglycine-generating enzyme family protein [Polyangiaceae bacterium]|nr:formylglycine-generating enzyme family protein [Polyangiaceae bacterium]